MVCELQLEGRVTSFLLCPDHLLGKLWIIDSFGLCGGGNLNSPQLTTGHLMTEITTDPPKATYNSVPNFQ